MENLAALAELYERHTGAEPTSIRRLAGDGSGRRIYRLEAPPQPSRVGVVGGVPAENRAFVAFSAALRSRDLPVPTVYEVDDQAGAWLEDDLGDETLFDAVVRARASEGGPFPPDLIETYRQVIDLLPRFQVEGGRSVPFDVAWPRATQDRPGILFDLNAFLFQFVRAAGIPFDEVAIEKDFERLAADLLDHAGSSFFLHRDFQSRNVMLTDDGPYVLDYQNGRRGWLGYDVASLLHDAKAQIPVDVRAELRGRYEEALARLAPDAVDAFRRTYPASIVLRTLQALGAYGLRGLTERKPSFLARIPARLADVADLLEDGRLSAWPELERVLDRCCREPLLRPPPVPDKGPLEVLVGSFSYKRGYPRAEQGHGGGMVFDCRAVENPGRQERYRSLSGRDEEVARFLDATPGAHAFLAHVLALADAQIDTYVTRGFTALEVHFGCTGGRHRSVYFAERLAAHIRAAFPDVVVSLHHAEEVSW